MADLPTAPTTDFPQSFRDPLYAALDEQNEQTLGLPDGLLSSIRTNGERSNASQVSSAGAQTPYQITPATRAAAIKQYGVDPYLSPQNASEVAGRLLADSLQRNGNDPTQAVGEYIGGTDRSNWGKQTQAYIQRVMSGVQGQQGGTLPLGGYSGPSTYDQASALMQVQQAPGQIAQIYQAYQAGQMTPDESAQFEQDVRSGKMMLPQGASLKAAPAAGGMGPSTTPPPVPDGVMAAFSRGPMTPQEMADFEHDVRSGAMALPPGTDPDALFGTPDKPKGVLDRLAAIPGNLAEAVTGSQRRTAATDSLPDWAGMPELNQLSMASFKTGVGTIASSPEETAQIIKKNFPGVQVTQDEKGNYLLRSSINGQQYAIPPGFHVSDIPRALATAGTFALANELMPGAGAGLVRNMAREGAVGAIGQTGLEGAKALGGGNFDAGNVATAAATGAIVPPAIAAGGAALAPARSMLAAVRGTPDLAPSALAGAPELGPEAATASASPAAMPSTLTDVAQAARAAANGGKSATERLAGLASPDPAVTDAAKRLGIENYLQPDHVTSSDAYRQVVGVLKSNPTSQLALGEKEGLANVAQRASNLISDLGGDNDLAAIDAATKANMTAAHADASAAEDDLWNQVRAAVPAKTPAPADSTMALIARRAEELGGFDKLTPMERSIAVRLAPRLAPPPASGAAPAVGDVLTPSQLRAARDAEGQTGVMVGQGGRAPAPAPVQQAPTWALLDDVRKDVGLAARMRGPFSDAETGLAKLYYSKLTADSEAAAGAGNADLIQRAKAATQVRKGMEDDLTALFGKKLDQSMVPQLAYGMRSAAQGDTSGLVRLLQATPDNLKQQVVASGLGTVFRNAASRGEINFTQFSKWYQNLERNQTAFHAVMANLPEQARQQIADLATVSRAISASQAARIGTGLRSSVLREMEAPDNLASRMFDLAKHAGKGLAADAVGGHGAGLVMGLMSALHGGAKPSAIKALDDLMTSPEFVHLASTAGTAQQPEAVRAFSFSRPFTRFSRALGGEPELTDRQRWVNSAMETRTGEANADR